MFSECAVGEGQVLTLSCIFPLLANIISWLLLFSGTVAIAMIIFSGIKLITSGGEAKTVDTAKKSITYAIIGLLLVFLSFMILNIIGFVTGVTCFDTTQGIPSFQSCTKQNP